MREIYSFVFVFMLLVTGFSILPEEPFLMEATSGLTRGIGEWTRDMNISNAAETSFIGENKYDHSGSPVSGAGDVNGDGYDDILIGAVGDEDGDTNAGQTYLIFGKESSWAMDTRFQSNVAADR